MSIVADSDVLIDFLRGKEGANRIASYLEGGNLVTTSISAFELWAGAKSQKQINAVETLLQALVILPLSAAAGRRAGHIRRNLDGAGQTVAMADCLIAGICIEHGADLLTRNKKHFERIPKLKLI